MVRWINKKSSSDRSTRSMNTFNCLIEEMHLVGIPFRNGLFSWSRSGIRPAASKLDKILLSKPWVDCLEKLG